MDIRFPTFSLARQTQAISSYTCCTYNMVKGRVSIKASWKHFCSSEKKMADKSRFNRNKINDELLLILEFSVIKQLCYTGLLDMK